MKKQLTKKLFFRKYPFKIELRCNGASLIKYRGIDNIIDACRNKKELLPRRYYWGGDDNINTTELLDFALTIKPFIDKGIKCRAESSHFNFFLENIDDFDDIERALKKWHVTSWAPSNDTELKFLTGNNRKIIVDVIPYDKFGHKVVFKDSGWTADKRLAFLKWLEKYPEDDFKVSKSTLRYLEGKSRYCGLPFIYVAEPKMLTMMTLFAGDNINYVEEFVVRSTLLP